MKISLNWINEFVDISDITPEEYAAKLTMTGSKVEYFENLADRINRVVVGKILSIEKHPNADKLVVCKVDVATDTVQIVTGASNLKVNDLVPVALDNSKLPGNVTIKKGKLRGVESFGMLCSLSELNLTVNDFPTAVEDGIFVLQQDCKPGDNVVDVLNLDDTVIEFEITPNRPDCLSVIGIARESAVSFDRTLKLHNPQVQENGGNINEMLSVEVVDPKSCPRYISRMITDVKIEPSPMWMRECLRASGVRPINNIVDITNYVMLEYGQPMHAFDYRFVKGNKIIVRRATDNEKITTLDGIERTLKADMLVIANEQGPMAIGGVMGGENSGIIDDTKTIVFESANFYGPSIRNTSRALALRSDSSAKFEKGLDAQNCANALERACELVEMLGAGKVVCGLIDVNNTNYEATKIELNDNWINSFIGINASKDNMIKILTDLGFTVKDDIITVPSYRADVLHKADIAEEVARIFGYEKIETTQLKGSAAGKLTLQQKTETQILNTLISIGFSEIQTFSFISPKQYDQMLVPQDSPLRNFIKISNPLGEDTSIMRTLALSSMMEVLSTNYNNRNMSVKLFEIATEYLVQKEDELPLEPKKIVIGAYGDVDYYDVKGAVEEILSQLNIKNLDVQVCESIPWLHPGRSAILKIGNDILGEIGEVHPLVVKNYDIDEKVYSATLDVNTLIKLSNNEKTYHKMPRFPASSRDLALICDNDTPVITIEKTIKKAAGKLIETINLFDVYTGSQVEEGKKSVAYNIVLRANDRTLTDEETDKAVNKILKALNDINVVLRH